MRTDGHSLRHHWCVRLFYFSRACDVQRAILWKVNKISLHENYSSHVPQPVYFMVKNLAIMTTLLVVVDSFYLIFTQDLMGNPLEKSLKLYVSFSFY
jgi:hypothetical protein